MANLPKEQIQKLIFQVTENSVLEKREIDTQEFITICRNYLKAIDFEMLKLQHNLTLKERVQAIGSLIHDDETILQSMLILSHAFEVQFNNFLNRQIHLAWISAAGQVYLGSEQAIINMYAKGSLDELDRGKEKTYRAYIKGRAYNFNPFELNDEMQKLQQDLRNSAENKRQLFQEGKRRYYNTTQPGRLNYPRADQPGLYWALDEDGAPKGWSSRIASGGYLGEGYLQILLDFPDISMSPVNGPVYNLDQQQYIQLLAKYSLSGDSVPGITRGDISVDDGGNIQLAIKQGKGFRTASIAGNIGIAQAFIDKQKVLTKKEIDKEKLKKKIQNIATVSYKELYDEVVNILNKSFIRNK